MKVSKLAQEYRKERIGLEFNENSKGVWVIFSRIAGIKLTESEYYDFKDKYNNYKSVTQTLPELDCKYFDKYTPMNSDTIWYVYPDSVCCMSNFIDNVVDIPIYPTDFYVERDRDYKLRIYKTNDNQFSTMSSKFNKLIEYANTRLYTDSPQGYVHGIDNYGTEDNELKLIIAPIDYDPTSSIKKLLGVE